MTPEQDVLRQSPTIASQLPYRFSNGYRLDSYQCYCSGCKAVLPDDRVRGRIIPYNDHMIVVEAMSYCGSCHLYSPSHYRVYDTLDFMGRDAQGRWQRWTSTYTVYAHVQRMVRRILRVLGFSSVS